MSELILRPLALATTITCLSLTSAFAHRIVGARSFSAMLATDDPCVADDGSDAMFPKRIMQ
jgi:hypothetical protein